MSNIAKAIFLIRTRGNITLRFRTLWWKLMGVRIGQSTYLPPRTLINWPHQVQIGDSCILETDVQFKYSAPYRPGPSIIIGNRVFLGRGCEFNCVERIEVGEGCLIASGCKFVDSNHGTSLDTPMNMQPLTCAPVKLERDVWLGANVVVLKGVHIGEGSIIAAGAVVTRSVPSGEIWAGIPARKMGNRYPVPMS